MAEGEILRPVLLLHVYINASRLWAIRHYIRHWALQKSSC